MSRHEDRCNPQMVTLARESRGLTQPELARLLSVNQGWLSRIEAGLRGIQYEQVEQIADRLKYPPEFFTRTTPVHGLGVASIFHRKLQSISQRTLKQIHALIAIRSFEIAKLLDGVDIADSNKIPLMPLEDYENPSEIAKILRASWHLPSGPVHNVVSVIESAKGIIVPFDFGTTDVDAIAHIPPGCPPLFFVNISSPTDRLRFTLCHELGHIVMHQSSLDVANMEQQANEFAAELLMPKKEIRHQFLGLSVEKLMILKQCWKVSMAALLKRAGDLGAVTDSKAKSLWITMGKLGYRVREPAMLDIPAEKPTLLKEVIETHLVDMGYSLTELSKMLCIRPEELGSLYIGMEERLLAEEKRAVLREVNKILKKSSETT